MYWCDVHEALYKLLNVIGIWVSGSYGEANMAIYIKMKLQMQTRDFMTGACKCYDVQVTISACDPVAFLIWISLRNVSIL